MPNLTGQVALVTLASRGVVRGVALGLGEAGATVYVTGRSRQDIHSTADEVTKLGGEKITVRCDHRDDEQVEALFQEIRAEDGRLHILVNNVWGGYKGMIMDGEWTWERPFWQQPSWRWDGMFQAGVRAHIVASYYLFCRPADDGSGKGSDRQYFFLGRAKIHAQ